MPHFNKTLVSTRINAGYPTAYSFYHASGGRRVFPFTYAYYLKIERGRSLPRPEWLALIIRTMRIIGVSEKARMAIDYLKSLSGPSYDDLFAPFLSAPEDPAGQTNMRRLIGRLALHMTPKQFLAISASPETYGCFLILVSTETAMSARELAASLAASEKKCADALRDLVRAGIVRTKSGGLHRIAHFGRHYTAPNASVSAAKQKSIHAYVDKLFTRAGRVAYNGGITSRMTNADRNSTAKELQGILETVAARAMTQKSAPDASLYLVECRVRELVGAQNETAGSRPHPVRGRKEG